MSIHSFRDNDSEYQDHMDISECIPSIKVCSLPLMVSSEELDSSNSSSKEAVYLDLIVRSPLNTFCIVIFRGMMLSLTVCKLSTVT